MGREHGCHHLLTLQLSTAEPNVFLPKVTSSWLLQIGRCGADRKYCVPGLLQDWLPRLLHSLPDMPDQAPKGSSLTYEGPILSVE